MRMLELGTFGMLLFKRLQITATTANLKGGELGVGVGGGWKGVVGSNSCR